MVDRIGQLTNIIVPIDVGGGAQISLTDTICRLFESGERSADAAPIDAMNSSAIKILTPDMCFQPIIIPPSLSPVQWSVLRFSTVSERYSISSLWSIHGGSLRFIRGLGFLKVWSGLTGYEISCHHAGNVNRLMRTIVCQTNSSLKDESVWGSQNSSVVHNCVQTRR